MKALKIIAVAVILYVAALALLSQTSAHAATGGGWSTGTKATRVYWKTVNGHQVPCRSAKRWVHKWGVSGVTGDTFDVAMWMTACLARPAGHPMFLYYTHYTPTASVCQWTCSIDAMTFSQGSWGCSGPGRYGCQSYGHRNQWKISHGYDLIGLHEYWYPVISMSFHLTTWAPGRGNIAYTSGATCGGC